MDERIGWLGRAGDGVDRLVLSERAYVVFGALLIAYTFFGALNLSCAGSYSDFWEHLAFMRAFAENPLHPANPYLPDAIPYHHDSPYHLFWGVVSRVVGVNPFLIAPVIGAINVGFFVFAVRLFAGRVLGDRRYALPLLLALLFLWWLPWEWSGFYDFGLLLLSAIYPYRFAFPLALVTISLYPGKGALGFLAYTLLVSATFLIHALTGSFLVLSLVVVACVVAWNERNPSRLIWLGPPAVGILLALTWPYFPVIGTIFLTQTAQTADYRLFYSGALWRLAPALPGIYAIFRAVRKREISYVTAGFIAVLLVYAANYLLFHLAVLSRYVIYVAFFLQIGVVLLLKDATGRRRRGLLTGGFVLLLAWGGLWESWIASQSLGIARDIRTGTRLGRHSDRRLYRELRRAFGPRLGAQNIVWARTYDSLMLPVFFRSRIVTVKALEPSPYIPADFAARRISAERRFFSDAASPEQRIGILRRFHVTNVVIAPADGKYLQGMERVLRPVAQTEDRLLYEVASD